MSIQSRRTGGVYRPGGRCLTNRMRCDAFGDILIVSEPYFSDTVPL